MSRVVIVLMRPPSWRGSTNVCRPRVDAPALVARVDECVQADLGECAGLAAGEIAEELRDDALRQIIGVNLFVERELAYRGHTAPIAGHHFAQQAVVSEAAQAFGLAVALAGGGEQAEIAGRAGLEVTPLQGLQQRLRHAGLHKAAARQRVAVAHKADGFVGADHLVFHERNSVTAIRPMPSWAGAIDAFPVTAEHKPPQ